MMRDRLAVATPDKGRGRKTKNNNNLLLSSKDSLLNEYSQYKGPTILYEECIVKQNEMQTRCKWRD